MKKLLLALALLLWAGPALSQTPQCGRVASGASGATTTAVVVGATGQTVHLCGWDVTATTAATFQVVTGTGATCGTGTANVTAAHAVSNTSTIVTYGFPFKFSANPGNGICVTITGTGPVQWTMYYTVLF